VGQSAGPPPQVGPLSGSRAREADPSSCRFGALPLTPFAAGGAIIPPGAGPVAGNTAGDDGDAGGADGAGWAHARPVAASKAAIELKTPSLIVSPPFGKESTWPSWRRQMR